VCVRAVPMRWMYAQTRVFGFRAAHVSDISQTDETRSLSMRPPKAIRETALST